jgi:arylsulfatase A-like enzyme
MQQTASGALSLPSHLLRLLLHRIATLILIAIFIGLSIDSAIADLESTKGSVPNIILILADDLAWADVGCYGSTFHETPNLDRLAAEGMRFTNGYAAHMSCSPSRAALLTGRYPARLKITAFIPGPTLSGKYLPATMRMQLPFEEVTLAEVLKQSGYATLFVGKWHLGDAPYFPEKQGFDVNIAGNRSGAPGSYFWPYGRGKKRGYHGIEVPGLYEDGQEGEHLCDRLTTEALKLVETKQDEPFFLYLSFYDVHTPIQAKQPLVEKYREKARRMGLPQEATFLSDGTEARGTKPGLRQNKSRQVQNDPSYAAMVETMDTNVGRVLDGLKQLNLDDNTIVIFTSDNGGYPPITSNLPFRGGKGWAYEGGTREPWLVKWPGVTKPHTECHVPVIFTDIFPTVLEMAGLPLRPDLHCDGLSFAPLLKGHNKPLHDALFWHYPHYAAYGCGPFSAIRTGDWKLIEWLEDNSVDLFNLAEDPGEQVNLATDMPERVAEMRDRLHQWRRDVDANMPRVR